MPWAPWSRRTARPIRRRLTDHHAAPTRGGAIRPFWCVHALRSARTWGTRPRAAPPGSALLRLCERSTAARLARCPSGPSPRLVQLRIACRSTSRLRSKCTGRLTRRLARGGSFAFAQARLLRIADAQSESAIPSRGGLDRLAPPDDLTSVRPVLASPSRPEIQSRGIEVPIGALAPATSAP